MLVEFLSLSGVLGGSLTASWPLPLGTLNFHFYFSKRVNEPPSTFHLSECQALGSTAVSFFFSL